MKHHAMIVREGHPTHLSAETPSRLAKAVSGEVEQFVDTAVTDPSPGARTMTVTAFTPGACFEISNETGEWISPLPKTR